MCCELRVMCLAKAAAQCTNEIVCTVKGACGSPWTLGASRIFERGLAQCGGDYLAHALWDKALQFELAAGQPLRAAAAYTRVLALPLRDTDRYWNRRAVM